MDDRTEAPFWRSPIGLAVVGFLLIAGFFLVTEHAAHLWGALPFLLLLACPLMHLFHHRGHGHHRHGQRPETPEPRS